MASIDRLSLRPLLVEYTVDHTDFCNQSARYVLCRRSPYLILSVSKTQLGSHLTLDLFGIQIRTLIDCSSSCSHKLQPTCSDVDLQWS